jgi:hypothetical protein
MFVSSVFRGERQCKLQNLKEQRSYRTPWNKGRLLGAKPPLRTKHVWSIRTLLQVNGQVRDLAMFNLAIDSKLRGCDVVSLKVEDVAPHGLAVDRAAVRQMKTGRPVRFELAEWTRQAIDTSSLLARSPAISCSPVVAIPKTACRHVNMRDWCPNGSALSGWMPDFSAPIPCAEPRRRSFIAVQVTSGPSNCF